VRLYLGILVKDIFPEANVYFFTNLRLCNMTKAARTDNGDEIVFSVQEPVTGNVRRVACQKCAKILNFFYVSSFMLEAKVAAGGTGRSTVSMVGSTPSSPDTTATPYQVASSYIIPSGKVFSCSYLGKGLRGWQYRVASARRTQTAYIQFDSFWDRCM
jgi:hypothetical protein